MLTHHLKSLHYSPNPAVRYQPSVAHCSSTVAVCLAKGHNYASGIKTMKSKLACTVQNGMHIIAE